MGGKSVFDVHKLPWNANKTDSHMYIMRIIFIYVYLTIVFPVIPEPGFFRFWDVKAHDDDQKSFERNDHWPHD